MRAGSPLVWKIFELVTGPWVRRHLSAHVAGGRERLLEGPLLLCSNHESFWDGFVMREVQRRLRPGGSFRAVVLESELRARPWLRPLGALGLAPGSVASVRAMLRTLSEVARTDRTSAVAYFPQGRIRPDDPRPLDFLPGVSAVASALSPATVLPVGLRLLPGRTRRIEAFVSIGDPILVRGPDTVTPGLIEAAVAEELDAIRAFLRTHGEDAPEQWPADGHALPRPVHRFRRIVGVATRLSRN